MSARRLQLLLIAAAALTLVALATPSFLQVVGSKALAGVRLVPTIPSTAAAPTTPTTTLPPTTTTPPRQLFVLTDSVVLGVADELAARLPGWDVTVEGTIGLTLDQAAHLLEQRTVGVSPTVVVALGYNSLWERDRRNYEHWATRFDAQADRIIAQLRSLGAKKIVWVTVRELSPEIVPGGWKRELGRYGFYFPYVNERLRALPARNPDVVLADWSAVSQQPGLTVDAIHVNEVGAQVLVDLIATTAGLTPSPATTAPPPTAAAPSVAPVAPVVPNPAGG